MFAVLVVGLLGVSCAGGVADETASGDEPTSSTQPPVPPSSARCVDGEGACSTGVPGLQLTVTGPPSAPEPVGPGADHPLATVDRDAGISVRLRDGTLLWLFGDTAARDQDGQIDYFVIGTAALANAENPTKTLDHVLADQGRPVAFSTPTEEFGPCPEADQRPGMWPSAAVVEPVGALDRVVVWSTNVCLGPGPTLALRGTSLAEWWYDPASADPAAPVQATMLDQMLWPDGIIGAVSAGEDGTVHVYRCDLDGSGGVQSTYGPCWVSRTDLATAADLDSYRDWDGEGFGAPFGDGVPMEMPAGRQVSANWPFPPGGFSVVQDPEVGAYVMVYSPWPGATDMVEVRAAFRPEGPWSEPVTVELPGCDDTIGIREFRCYAATAQPVFSGPGALGVGFYDSLVVPAPRRGAYMVTRVPIRVDASPGQPAGEDAGR